MTKAPCKVYHPRKNGGPDKELTANTAEELEALLRIGWKLEASK
jgi:hypothetical protein